jgi:hypothetical protein
VIGNYSHGVPLRLKAEMLTQFAEHVERLVRREERRLELRMVGQKFWCARTSKGLNSGPRVVASAGLVPTRV